MRQGIDAPESDDLTALASVLERHWRVVGADRDRVEQVCVRPELHLLASGVTIRTNVSLDRPFRVPSAAVIELAPDATRSSPALRVYLRHALEIALWHRVTGPLRTPAQEIAAAALASTTTLRYLDTLSIADRDIARATNPTWFGFLESLFSARREREGEVRLAPRLLEHCAGLLPLQAAALAGADDPLLQAEAAGLIEALLPLASPTERLLAWGGDGRLAVNPQSRLNKYGCGTVPRPAAVTFSSCTASSTSEISFRSSEVTRERLIEAVLRSGSYPDACGTLMERTRREVSEIFGFDRLDGAEIVLAASGTDCELFALYVALAGHTRDLLSIIMGPDEIGSGSLPAASGCHFDAVAPLNRTVPLGSPVEGLAVGRLRVETLPLRDEAGAPVALGELDERVASLARTAVAQGANVLVHVVDSSKTGLRAPSLACVANLQRELGDRVTVLIDAAQMRTRAGQLRECAAAGAMVMISGSKFVTGSPFSGALIVPSRHAAVLDGVDSVPPGFGAYISRLEVPARWDRLRAGLPETPNIGLLLRWRAALAEMQAFAQVPEGLQNRWYRDFRIAVTQGLQAYRLNAVEAPVGDRTQGDAWEDWDKSPSIFTFFLPWEDAHGRPALMDYEQACQVHMALNRDVSAALPARATASERQIASTACHIGQPVRLRSKGGEVKGALRVAVGARYASRLAFDAALGPDPEARKTAQLADLDRVLHKIEILVRYWPDMTLTAAQ